MFRFSLSVVLVSFFLAGTAHAKDADEFAYSREWLAIIHYQPKMFGGYESTIDSKSFFLSEDGKTNPKNELKAAIKAFNSKDVSKQCIFPARYKLLKKAGFIENVITPYCTAYDKFYKDLSPAGVTLLFTDAYMNNPSSLFGHTLFRIDTSRKGTQLLAHGMNYGAFVDEDDTNPIMYAIMGLTGGYYGGFTVKPYYDVINLYNNIENRDIWEFGLNLGDEELDMFVAHLWELGHSESAYYFLTKNCSYMLMEVLDAVKPDLELAGEFPVQTIPLDTVRAVYSKQGLVKDVNYRPSRQAKIKNQYNQMSPEQRKALLKIVKDSEYELDGLSGKEKAGIIETAYQYVQYQNVERELEREEYREKSFTLLKERNKLKEKDEFSPPEKGESLLEAHKSARAAASFGFRNGEAFQEVMFRPAYHSMIDNSYAYLKGAEIDFLNVSARHYDNSNKYVLQDVDIIGIKSLSPRDELFKPVSYSVKASLNREMNPDDEEEGYVFNLKAGGGLTYELHESLWFYAMLNGHFGYGGFLDRNQWAGAGLAGGLFSDFGKVRVVLEAESVLATSKYASKMRYNAEAAYSFTNNLYFVAGYTYLDNYGHDVDESKFSVRYHF